MKNINWVVPAFVTVLISACGGGSSGDSPGVTPSTPEQINNADVRTGRFVDSAVAGMGYVTETQSGETGADGSFSYLVGESITFSIGEIDLPTIPVAEIITPLDVFSTDNIADVRVMNLSRLLQTLDSNAYLIDGISLSDAAIASTAGLNVDFASASFDDQVVNLVANSGSEVTSLIDGMDALDHLQETLFNEGIEERPAPPTNSEPPAGEENPATHPLVGTSAEFSNLAHDISGTLTVLDDRTLQVTDFNYDGGGVIVFFYTGTDGDYRDGSPGVTPIGPQLNGRRYTDETITLTLPTGLTLDDFNGLSVWCVPFAASFGDARL